MPDMRFWGTTTCSSTRTGTPWKITNWSLCWRCCARRTKAPISYHYVYIDASEKLACFDLAQGTYEVRYTKGLREKLMFSSSD